MLHMDWKRLRKIHVKVKHFLQQNLLNKKKWLEEKIVIRINSSMDGQ